MKKIVIYFVALLLLVSIAFAHGDEISEGKELVDKKVKCSDLKAEDLEHIGDYLMDQMHPGEAHESMDKAMGGEGSEQLKQMHVRMAKMMYCGEGNMMQMMGGGMMNVISNGMMNQAGGMMGTTPYYGYGDVWNIVWWLFWAGIILFAIWLIYKYIIKENNDEDPSRILKIRFAKGEITKKQYENIKKDLER